MNNDNTQKNQPTNNDDKVAKTKTPLTTNLPTKVKDKSVKKAPPTISTDLNPVKTKPDEVKLVSHIDASLDPDKSLGQSVSQPKPSNQPATDKDMSNLGLPPDKQTQTDDQNTDQKHKDYQDIISTKSDDYLEPLAIKAPTSRSPADKTVGAKTDDSNPKPRQAKLGDSADKIKLDNKLTLSVKAAASANQSPSSTTAGGNDKLLAKKLKDIKTSQSADETPPPQAAMETGQPDDRQAGLTSPSGSPFDVEDETETGGLWGTKPAANSNPNQSLSVDKPLTDKTDNQTKPEVGKPQPLSSNQPEAGIGLEETSTKVADPASPPPASTDPPLDAAENSDKQPPTPPEDKADSPPSKDGQSQPASTNLPKKKFGWFKILIVLGLVAGIGLSSFFLLKKFNNKPGSNDSALNNGQTNQQGQNKKNISLTYWGLWESEEIMKPVFDKFEQETGISVNYVQRSPRDYRLILENAIKEGKGPDIFRIHNTWVPMFKDELDNLPKQIYSRDEFAQTFYPITLQDLTVDNQIKGIPLEVDGLVLFYNKDLLTKANLLENIASNWDQLSKQAKQLTEYNPDGSIKTSGAGLGTTNNIDHWSDIVGLMFYQNGVDMERLDTSVDAKGRNLAADVLRYYTHFVTGSTPVWDKSLPSSTVMFASGRLAYYFGPSWRAFEFAKNGVNFGIVNVPKIPGDSSEWATYWVEGVSIKSSHKQEAWRLLKFLTQPDNLRLFFNQASQKRLFGEAYPRLDMREELLKHPYLYAIAQAAPNYKSYFFASFTHDQGLNDRINDFLGQGVNQVIRGKSPEQAVGKIQQEINQILANYNVKL